MYKINGGLYITIEKPVFTTHEIEQARLVLGNTDEVCGLTHSLTLHVSQYLDKLITEAIQKRKVNLD